ncbi:MAG: hypothetical protein WBM14_03830 [Terracidiphilus sp.]
MSRANRTRPRRAKRKIDACPGFCPGYDTIHVPTEIGLFLAEALAQPVSRAAAWDKSQALAGVDQAFFRMVMGQQL